MESTRQDRVLEIFFRALRGEDITVSALANEYGVSTKSISRNINDLKAFFADHRELVGGLRFVHEPKTLRFFTGRLEPVSDWPRKLIEAYIKDFGEDQ